jgi:hypothetical protein
LAASEKLLTELRVKGLPASEKSDAEFLKWLKSISPADARRYWEMTNLKWQIREELVELWLLTLDPSEMTQLDYLELSNPSHVKNIIEYYYKIAMERGEENLSSLLLKNLPKTIRAADSPYAWVALRGIYRWFAIDNEIMTTDANGFRHVTSKSIKQIHQSLKAWYDQSRGDFKWDEREQQFTKGNGEFFHLPPIQLHFK